MDSKKKRSKNFTLNEKMRIVDLITSSGVLITKKTGGPNYNWTAKLKEAAWEKILQDLNSRSSSQRSLVTLKKAWDNLKRDARVQRANIRCQNFETGGGPSVVMEDPLLQKVEAAIGISSSGRKTPFHPSANIKSAANLTGDSSTIYPAAIATESVKAIPDPLFVKLECEDIVPARQSSLLGPSSKKLKKPLARRRQVEHEALDTSEDILPKPMITRVSQPRFALSWESYQNRLCSKLSTLLKNEDFVDLTLAAGGHLVKVHQLIMSIASPYLEEIIHSSPARHPIIFLTNVSYPTLKNLLQYVYTGQVDITEDELEPFFAAAKALQIHGIDAEIDTEILKSQTGDVIRDAARLPPDPNETAAEEDDPDDDSEESKIILTPRSATNRTCNSPNAGRILSKRRSTHCTLQTKKELLSQTEELEPGDQGDVMMDEEDTVVVSEDLSGGVDPIEFLEVSRTNDPNPVNSPPHENAERVTFETMLLNHYKYTLARTFEGGVRQWRCIDHLTRGCQARTVTTGDTVVERSQFHNHSYHDKK